MPVEVGNSVSHCTQRRHQGCRDGDTGDHCTFLLARQLQDTRYAAKKRNHHVIDGRVGTCEQFGRIVSLQWCHQKIQRRGNERDGKHDAEVLERLHEQFGVVGAEPHTKTDDRTHQRRNQHRANDDGNGVDIQSHTGDNDGHEQDIDCRSTEGDVIADVLTRGLDVNVVRQPQLLAEKFPRFVFEFLVCHNTIVSSF